MVWGGAEQGIPFCHALLFFITYNIDFIEDFQLFGRGKSD
jgi:hypothetical protein